MDAGGHGERHQWAAGLGGAGSVGCGGRGPERDPRGGAPACRRMPEFAPP